MSERLSTSETASSTAATSSARPDRRQSRRAGLSLQVRLRAADFNDGNFEEVRTTVNVSRKALYFFTQLDRYYKGMRIRVTFPYNPKPGVADLEQDGEVVRVDRRQDGYGVAVALSSANSSSSAPGANSIARSSSATLYSPATQVSVQSVSTPNRVEIERRCASRSPFVAPIELIDMRAGSSIQARVSDLSLRGCYVDTLNPLPIGAAIRLQIRHADATFNALAHVSSSHVGSGMGVVFAEISLAQRMTLRNWLGDSALPPEIGFSAPRQSVKRARADDVEQLYAVRLIHALVRKGIFSQSEASELLRDPDAL